MFRLIRGGVRPQSFPFTFRRAVLSLAGVVGSLVTISPAWAVKPVLDVPDAAAASEAEMKPYTDKIANTQVSFQMLPIKGGKYMMGSPDSEKGNSEKGHNADESPQHEVEVSPFWMGKYEVSWDEYEIFMFNLDIARRTVTKEAAFGIGQSG